MMHGPSGSRSFLRGSLVEWNGAGWVSDYRYATPVAKYRTTHLCLRHGSMTYGTARVCMSGGGVGLFSTVYPLYLSCTASLVAHVGTTTSFDNSIF